jgi:hypothetical protein
VTATNRWRVFGASVVGASHLRAGLPCQDAHAWRVRPDGTLLMAVADGAGSAERSDLGAQAAVAAALDALEQQSVPAGADWQPALWVAFEAARGAVELLAAVHDLPSRAFASTLLCAVVTPHGLATAQLGDGLAVVGLAEGGWKVAASPQRGEYANETHFLTQPGVLAQVEFDWCAAPPQAAVLLTDGLLRLVLDLQTGQPHSPFFEPLLAFAARTAPDADGQAQLAAFLSSDRVNARTDDDKSLVLAVRQPAA